MSCTADLFPTASLSWVPAALHQKARPAWSCGVSLCDGINELRLALALRYSVRLF